jgi:hypothetical protein
MKAITLLACAFVVLVLATFIKGCMNESRLAANQDGGLPSSSIARSKKDGLFIRQYNVEQINLTSSDIKIGFKEAWLERLAEDEYEFYWIHKRIPMNGQQIVLVKADGIAGDLTLWLEGAGRGFARSRSFYYSGDLPKAPEFIKLNIIQDGHKEPCGYIILKPSD